MHSVISSMVTNMGVIGFVWSLPIIVYPNGDVMLKLGQHSLLEVQILNLLYILSKESAFGQEGYGKGLAIMVLNGIDPALVFEHGKFLGSALVHPAHLAALLEKDTLLVLHGELVASGNVSDANNVLSLIKMLESGKYSISYVKE